MKKVIFLIISSSNLEIYSVMKNISRQCFNKAKEQYNIEYFFVESQEQNIDVKIQDDIIYVNGKESLGTILEKTSKAMRIINKQFDYDIIIRTNLSSFWNIENLYKLLETLGDKKVATGYTLYWDKVFIHGTGIIMSRDICENICNCNLIGAFNGEDDVFLSQAILRFTPIRDLSEDHMLFRLDDQCDIIPDDISKVLYFRVKSEQNRYENDSNFFKGLAKKIYNIDC